MQEVRQMIEGFDLDGDGVDGDVTEEELVPDGEEMDQQQPQDFDENQLADALIRSRGKFE